MTTALPLLGARQPPANAHDRILEVLRGSQFHLSAVRPPPRSWWDLFWAWVGDRFGEIGNAFGRHVHVNSAAQSLLGLALLAAIAIAIAAVMVLLLRNAAGDSRSASSPGGVAPRVAAERLALAANEAGKRGEYRKAIALLFRAALTVLDLRGIVHDEPSVTVNEFRRELRGRSAPQHVRSSFDALARSFTGAAYARRAVGESDWESARAEFEALVEAARA